jgi:hypothetical protein
MVLYNLKAGRVEIRMPDEGEDDISFCLLPDIRVVQTFAHCTTTIVSFSGGKVKTAGE